MQSFLSNSCNAIRIHRNARLCNAMQWKIWTSMFCVASLIPDSVCVPICEVGEVLLNYKPSNCLLKAVCIFKARYSLSYILIHFNFFNYRFGLASWSSSKSVLQNHKLLNDSNWWSFLHQTLYSNENNIYLYFVQPSFI